MNSRAPGLVARCQRAQVLSLNLFVVQEYVVEGAVDDGVETIFEPVESCRIRHPEVDRYSGALRVALGSVDRRGGAVNSRRGVALRCVVDRMMAWTRPGVEHFACQSAVCDQLLDHWLRSADVPWRQRGQAIYRPVVTVQLVETLPTNLISDT
jgi:hypothetical protein